MFDMAPETVSFIETSAYLFQKKKVQYRPIAGNGCKPVILKRCLFDLQVNQVHFSL